MSAAQMDEAVAGYASEGGIVQLAVALGAQEVAGWSRAEAALAAKHRGQPSRSGLASLRAQIRAGGDPLGESFCVFRPPEQRRPLGQTYTPAPIIDSMLDWASDQATPGRVMDPGAGSGRYLCAAARRFPKAQLVGAEVDPLAALIARANLAVLGAAKRSHIMLADYRGLVQTPIDKTTLYIGNPPYVRHHQIGPEWKKWLLDTAKARGLTGSALAGLHVYFFLATAEQASPGDLGCFITSAEWLDVNYGSLVRELLLEGLGGVGLHVLEPSVAPFADAATTGAITCFKVGARPSSVKVRQVKDVPSLGRLDSGRLVARARLAEANRWSVLTRVTPKLPEGYIELGELCRVHRGTVTGANAAWVTKAVDTSLPASVLTPAVTKARELFAAGDRLADTGLLKRVIDLPVDLDILDPKDRVVVEKYLALLKKRRVHEGYIASTRKAWWSVGLRAAAPVLATYMARRPPAFVHNDAGARHINIAHGLYPRQPLSDLALINLVKHLRTAVTQAQGRTYAGGLTKFEPKEMERLTVPGIDLLTAAS
jgi:hypothetical protein